MKETITAIREFVKLPLRQQLIVVLIVLIVGMGFLAKYLWDEVKRQNRLNENLQAEVRKVTETKEIDAMLCDQKLFAQQLRSDSIKEKEKQDLIKLFGDHAEKVEKLLTRKK